MSIYLGSPEAVSQAVATTSRLLRVFELPFSQKTPLKRALAAAQAGIDGSATFEQIKGPLLDELTKRNITLYQEPVAAAPDFVTLEARVSTFSRDMLTAPQELQLKRPSDGLVSPPVLISFPRMGKDKKRYEVRYIEKWLSDPSEILDTHKYQPFCLPGGFKVPKTAGFISNEATFISDSGETTLVDPKMIEQLRQNSLFFLEKLKTDIAPFQEKQVLLIAEYIKGKSGLDFVLEKGGYKDLTPEQKDLFWQRLGQLCYADLVLGQDDRLLRAEDQTKLPSEDNLCFGAKLDNVLVEEGTLDLYAIDNGLKKDLARKPTETTQEIAQAVIESIRATFVDCSKQDVVTIQADLDHPAAFESLEKGIAEMRLKCG